MMKSFQFVVFVSLVLLVGCGPSAQDEGSVTANGEEDLSALSPSDQLWKELEEATSQPQPPASWESREPSAEDVQQFRAQLGQRAMLAATKAKEFHTRFVDDARADQARQIERDMLQNAILSGNYEKLERLEEIESSILDDPSLTEDQKFDVRARAIQRKASLKASESEDAAIASMLEGVLELRKDFPDRKEPLEMMLMLAESVGGKEAESMLQDIITHAEDKALRASAVSMKSKMDALGKPLDLSFTSLQGNEIDLQTDYKGQVVLLDFWATWCGPCIVELPNVKEVYKQWHDKGFEILGISLDNDEDALRKFIKKEDMTWPQFFDGKGWENKYAVSFGIRGIPAMWLIDQNGLLVDMNARSDLTSKVEALLSEP